VHAALSGQSAAMIGFRRLSSEPYRAETMLVPIEEVMLHERRLPPEYVDTENNGIRASFSGLVQAAHRGSADTLCHAG